MSKNEHNDTNVEPKELENLEIKPQNSKEDKKRLGKSIVMSFQNKKFKRGAYSTLISAIVIVVVILVNLIAGQLNLSLDLSKQGMYSLTKDTKKIAAELKDDITIYYLTQEGKEVSAIKKIVSKYANISDKIKVVQKDPVLYPKFASQYTDETILQDSVIVVNNANNRSKYVDYGSLLETQIDYNTYQPQVTGLDVEGQITSAIQYVTSDNLPVMYVTTGHQETEIGSSLKTLLVKKNIDVKSLNTLTTESIPEDCDVLLINGPRYDLTEDETKRIQAYLESGGKAILITTYTGEDMTNYNKLLDYYGVTVMDGILMEDSAHSMNNNPLYIYASALQHGITSSIADAGRPVLALTAQGLKISDTLRSTVNIEKILTTSEASFNRTDLNADTPTKQTNDVGGPFPVGLAITENYNNVETKLVVYSTGAMFEDSVVSFGSLANGDLLANTIHYLVGETTSTLSIPVRSLEQTYISISGASAGFWAFIVVILLPITILVLGFSLWFIRRKR